MEKEKIYKIGNSAGETSGMMTHWLLFESGINKNNLIISFQNTGDEHQSSYKFLYDQQLHWDKEFVFLEYEFPEGFEEVILKKKPTYENLAKCNKKGTLLAGMLNTELLDKIKWNDEWRIKIKLSKIISESKKNSQAMMFGNEYYQLKETVGDYTRCLTDFYGLFGKKRGELNDRFKRVEFNEMNKTGVPLLKDILYKGAIRYVKGLPFVVPNPNHRFSTGDLKIRTSEYFMQNLGFKREDYINVLGIRFDESDRYWNNLTNDGITWMPLFEQKITKEDVRKFWDKQPFQLDIRNKRWLGNCVDCYLKAFERRIKACQDSPEHFERRAIIEEATGDEMVRGMPAKKILEMSKFLQVEDKESQLACMCG